MKLVPLFVLSTALLVAGCDSGESDGPPRTARIIKVTVNDAPLVDVNGDGWDGGSDGPEIYFRLFDSDVDFVADPGSDRLNPRDDDEVIPLDSGSDWYNDVDAGSFPLVWDIEPGYVVRDLDDQLYITLFDYDPTTGDDPMAESSVFRLETNAPARVTGTPSVINLTGVDLSGNPTDFSVRLTVVYDD